MRRYHLFEFEDLQWFPQSIRNYGTDFLRFVANQFDFYKGVIPVIKKGLKKSGTDTVVDLASGGGGGWLKIIEHLKREGVKVRVVLTDYYPNIEAFNETIKKDENIFSYEKSSVDARHVPAQLRGLRTQFLSLHHFRPEEAKQILQNAVDNNVAIAIFEAQERDWLTFFKFMLSPLNVILLTPFIRPFKIGRIFFTYILPIVPLFILWDGLVSVLRTYNLEELRQMTKSLERTETFSWELEKVKTGPSVVLYVLGYPKQAGNKKAESKPVMEMSY